MSPNPSGTGGCSEIVLVTVSDLAVAEFDATPTFLLHPLDSSFGWVPTRGFVNLMAYMDASLVKLNTSMYVFRACSSLQYSPQIFGSWWVGISYKLPISFLTGHERQHFCIKSCTFIIFYSYFFFSKISWISLIPDFKFPRILQEIHQLLWWINLSQFVIISHEFSKEIAIRWSKILVLVMHFFENKFILQSICSIFYILWCYAYFL